MNILFHLQHNCYIHLQWHFYLFELCNVVVLIIIISLHTKFNFYIVSVLQSQHRNPLFTIQNYFHITQNNTNFLLLKLYFVCLYRFTIKTFLSHLFSLKVLMVLICLLIVVLNRKFLMLDPLSYLAFQQFHLWLIVINVYHQPCAD